MWSPYRRRSRRLSVFALLDGSASLAAFAVNLWYVSYAPTDPPEDGGLGYEHIFWRYKVPEGRLKRYALGVLGLPLFLPFCWLGR